MTVILTKRPVRCGVCQQLHTDATIVDACSERHMIDYAEFASDVYAYAEGYVRVAPYEALIDRWLFANAPETVDADPIDDDLCEHGLAGWLCVGPSHYPTDM